MDYVKLSWLLLLFVLESSILNAGESDIRSIRIYNKSNPSAQLDMSIDLNSKIILIKKMEFKGPVATGMISHKTTKPIEIKANKITINGGHIVVNAGYRFEEGLALKMEIEVLLDETTKKPQSAEMDMNASLEELSIRWRPQLLEVDYK